MTSKLFDELETLKYAYRVCADQHLVKDSDKIKAIISAVHEVATESLLTGEITRADLVELTAALLLGIDLMSRQNQ